MFRTIVLLICLLMPVTAMANERVFRTAISAWLDGNDAQSLPVLAELAAEGNTDARLVLARIETADKGPSPFRLSLSNDAARKLFRWTTETGGFARGWLSLEARMGNPLAQAFLNAKYPQPDLDTIAALHKLGEIEATDHPTRIIALYGTQADRDEMRESPLLLEDLQPYLDYLSGPPEPRGDGLSALRHMTGMPEAVTAGDDDTLGMAGILALGYGYGDISAQNRWRGPVEDWILSARSTRPIADLCRERCGEEVETCAFAFLALSGGYYEVIRLDSPTETHIPQDEFLASPRARLMTLRRAALARAETNLDWLASHEDIAQMSLCAADLIEAARAEYPDLRDADRN